MKYEDFPIIDPIATGKNILSLRKQKGLTVRDLQEYFGFEEPQAIYRWQYGKTLPSVDNLYALSAILGVPMESILVPMSLRRIIKIEKQQESPAASVILRLINEEVCINDAYFFFFCGFSHYKNNVRIFCIVTYRCPLGFKQKVQILCQT